MRVPADRLLAEFDFGEISSDQRFLDRHQTKCFDDVTDFHLAHFSGSDLFVHFRRRHQNLAREQEIKPHRQPGQGHIGGRKFHHHVSAQDALNAAWFREMVAVTSTFAASDACVHAIAGIGTTDAASGNFTFRHWVPPFGFPEQIGKIRLVCRDDPTNGCTIPSLKLIVKGFCGCPAIQFAVPVRALCF